MDQEKHIAQLWEYFKIQAEETLIIPVYNFKRKQDEYYITQKIKGELVTRLLSSYEEFMESKFRIIQHIGKHGRKEFPSVSQIKKDEVEDY